MSFVELLPKRHGRPRPGPIRIGVTPTHLVVSIDRSAAKNFKWRVGCRILVSCGKGEDAGKLRLAPAERGYTLSGQDTHRHLRVLVPAWNGLPAHSLQKEAEFVIIEADPDKRSVIEITLPWRNPGGRHVKSFASGETRPTADGGGEATAPPVRPAQTQSLEAI